MSFHVLKKACWGKGQSISMNRISRIFSSKSRSFSQPPSPSQSPPTFGIAFDIDGVLLLGNSPVGGSPSAIRTLYDEAGSLRIPYVFLTNGGGYPESKRALELSRLLGVNVSASQVLQGHSPFKQLSNRFKNEFVIAVGKGEPAAIMSEYGYNNVLSIDDYASLFENIDPLAQYKRWATKQGADRGSKIEAMTSRNTVCSQRVRAAFIVSDSVDWSRDIQVLCDILRTGGFPGRYTGPQPHLYFANDDLEYQAVFPSERLGMGAFRIALESIFNRIHANPLEYTSFGKPNPFVFRNAEIVLERLAQSIMKKCQEIHDVDVHHFERLYMIGDNPKVDIKGARQAGYPWFSILTRTGVFKGNENHANFPADLVVDTVEEAVDYILRREGRL